VLEYESVRAKTMELCAPLEVEDHVVQPYGYVSPPKWHLGHTTWFFETFCLREFFRMDLFDSEFPFVFNSYYESQGEHVAQPRRGVLSRPTLGQVREYRMHVDSRMREASAAVQQQGGERRDQWNSILRLGLEHEQQHQELLLMDIKAILFEQPGRPAYQPSDAFTDREVKKYGSDGWHSMREGLYEIGFDGGTFAYDNESPRHRVFLHEYQISRGLVTNAEYKEFIEDGGYERPELWLSDGWRWVRENRVAHPLYWVRGPDNWLEYTLGGLVPLPGDCPVAHVSYFEADAYARWKKARLPTEAEWEAALHAEPKSDFWQWTQSAYLPYPGYTPFSGAFAEYNGKFMSGQMVLRGGCLATPAAHYRPTYRNFFYPEMRWQFSSIRLAR
jgi:ergothioneine biosynthesis protein EgtB